MNQRLLDEVVACNLSRMITAHIRRHRAVIHADNKYRRSLQNTTAPDKSKEVNQNQLGAIAIAEDMTFVLIVCIMTECG